MTAPLTGAIGVLSATGNMLYRDASGNLTEIDTASASNGQVLSRVAGVPAWATGSTPPVTWGNNTVQATTTTRYLTPWYDDVLAPTAPIQWRIPRAGTFRNMRVRHNTTAGNGNLIVYTLRVNSVASTLAVSLASTAADGSDLANSAAVAAGDLLDIEVTKALAIGSSPVDITLSMEFAP